MEARRRDSTDELAVYRERFYFPRSPNGDRAVYLDGNSLGLMSRDAERSLEAVVNQWKGRAVEAWSTSGSATPWFTLPETLAARIGAILGAELDSVAVTGSTTGNLHQILGTYFDAGRSGRNRILGAALNFPSDGYAVDSHVRLRGLDPATHVKTVGSRDGWTLDESDIIAAMTDDIQIAVLPSVLFVSGQLLNIAGITREARERGILIAWDCSHSVGTIPHQLDADGIDFAFWCHYKYFNAGPGSVAGLYVNRRHWGRTPGIAGWWGSRKDRQFEMHEAFTPAGGAGALQIGTPPLLSLAPLDGALAVHEAAGIDRIRRNSLALTTFLREAAEATLVEFGVACVTPERDDRRGGHLALTHPDASTLGNALRAYGVIPDVRPPNVLRFAPVALYNTFADCVSAVRCLHYLLKDNRYKFMPESSGSEGHLIT